jgi:multidrug efflux pump subunit AcrA (membrane-fusion protein)
MQKNQSQAGIENAKTNIDSLDSQIKALKAQEDIQLNQLNNQLTQLQSSLNTININLNPQILYAGTNGVIKDKLLSVGNRAAANANICQILPEKSSLKIQVYSSQDIALPADVTFQLENKLYTTKLSNRLTYQDPTTQNYTYEANSPIQSDGKIVNITDILSEGKIIDTNVSMKE